MSIPIGKKYKLEKSENFDEFLKELGVNYLIRKMANNVSSTVEMLLDDDGTYSFNTISTFRTQELKFKPGVEFEEKRMDGETVKCTVTIEGNKMIQKQTGSKPVTIEREFSDAELFVTCTVGNVVSKRWFKVVE